MQKILLIGLILTGFLLSDTNIGTPIGSAKVQKKIQQKARKIVRIKKLKKFKKDNHRYNKQYKNFDYNHQGYYNDEGFYFGFFNKRGYFYNNIYFEYNAKYTYRDRLYIRGFFEPYQHHYRKYRHHNGNDWNRVHSYREPDVIVYHHYYDDRYYPSNQDRYRERDYYEYQRDRYRRDDYYRNGYDRRDGYRGGQRRDNARIKEYKYPDKTRNPSSNYRSGNGNHRSNHNRKPSQSSGRMQISK